MILVWVEGTRAGRELFFAKMTKAMGQIVSELKPAIALDERLKPFANIVNLTAEWSSSHYRSE